MKLKIISLIAIVCLMSTSLCACSGSKTEKAETTTTIHTVEKANAKTTTNNNETEENTENMTQKMSDNSTTQVNETTNFIYDIAISNPMNVQLLQIFNSIKIEEYQDVTPISLLGTQIVAGQNYAFLAQSIDDNNNPLLLVIVIYEDFNGNTEVTDVKEINLTELPTTSNIGSLIAGGWNTINEYTVVKIPEEIQCSFDEQFISNGDDITYNSLAYLGNINGKENEYSVLYNHKQKENQEIKTELGIATFNINEPKITLVDNRYINILDILK